MDKDELMSIKDENDYFIKTIIKKKYCHEGENGLDDIKERFRRTLKSTDFSNVDYFVDNVLFNTFIPGGSIIYGFGSNKNISMSNCYFIPIEEDSIDGIGKAISRNMKVFSWRGGVGNSFEILRPKGSKVNNAANSSTGSVSFMPLFSNATQTIGQNGRRGASIFSHAIWHPDIEDFIKSKAYPEEVFTRDILNNTLPKITGANISVKLTNDFMEKVETDEDWNLVFPDINDKNYSKWNGDLSEWKGSINTYKIVKSSSLLKLIAESSWKYAEPGVLFWDNVIDDTPMSVVDRLKPRGVNPCGEEILANYDSCNLGAMVLYKFVDNPYSKSSKFNLDMFKKHVRLAVEFMDIVLDLNKHPLEEQNEINKYGRKIGLGITGLADMLAMLSSVYGSDESINITRDILSRKALEEVKESIELAIKKGPCEALLDLKTRKRFANHKYFKRLSEIYKDELEVSLDNLIVNHGLRNISLSTIAPTGTISIVMGNCTSGIEPLFSFEYYRKSTLLDKQVRVIHPILFNYLLENNPSDLDLPKDQLMKKYNYIESHSLNYKKRIDMQSACQEFITDSISSTINLPKETTVEQIMDIYKYAYKKRLKGITIYRDGCDLSGILSQTENNTESDNKVIITKESIKNIEEARRYRVKWKNNIKTYITVTLRDSNPIEVFAKVPKEAGLEKGNFNPQAYLEKQGYWDALCRLISLDLRSGIPLEEIVKQLDRSSYAMYDLPAIIKRILSQFLPKKSKESNQYEICPECGEPSLTNQNGCEVCLNCGYSKCS